MADVRIVCVTGSAHRDVRADRATATFLAQSRDPHQSVTTATVRKQASAFVQAAQELQVPGLELKVRLLSVFEREDVRVKGKQEVRTFASEALVSVVLCAIPSAAANPAKPAKPAKTRKVGESANPFAPALGKLFALAEKHGLLRRELDWSLTPSVAESFEHELLEEAAAAARQKAQALARGAGSRLGSVLAVNPPSGFLAGGGFPAPSMSYERKVSSRARMMAEEEEKGSSGSWQAVMDLEVPEITLHEEVTVYFKLE